MIDLLSTFPNAREKNRRTARGKKPMKYVANAPSLVTLVNKMFASVPVAHNECHRGCRRYWFLIHDLENNRYGYSTINEHEKIPFEANCASLANITQVCANIEHQVQWYPNVVDLVKMVAQQLNPGGTKSGTNLNFIEMVKNKFPEQFTPPDPKLVNKYNPYYSFGNKTTWDDPWGMDYGLDYDYNSGYHRR